MCSLGNIPSKYHLAPAVKFKVFITIIFQACNSCVGHVKEAKRVKIIKNMCITKFGSVCLPCIKKDDCFKSSHVVDTHSKELLSISCC